MSRVIPTPPVPKVRRRPGREPRVLGGLMQLKVGDCADFQCTLEVVHRMATHLRRVYDVSNRYIVRRLPEPKSCRVWRVE
jgi:hypothetical protein